MTRGAGTAATFLRRMALVVLLTVAGSMVNGAWAQQTYVVLGPTNETEMTAMEVGSTKALPTQLRSPLCTGFTYYGSQSDAESGTGGQSDASSFGASATVYVKYTYDDSWFAKGQLLNINWCGQPLRCKSIVAGTGRPYASTSTDFGETIWTVTGTPYAMQIHYVGDGVISIPVVAGNNGNNDSYLRYEDDASYPVNKFILLGTSSEQKLLWNNGNTITNITNEVTGINFVDNGGGATAGSTMKIWATSISKAKPWIMTKSSVVSVPDVTFHIRGHETDADITTTLTNVTENATIATAWAQAGLTRRYCSNYRFYTDDTYTTEISGSALVGTSDRHIYVDFTFSGAPFDLSASEATAKWHFIKGNNNDYFWVNQTVSGHSVIWQNGNVNNTTYNTDQWRNATLFAFVGTDPYDITIINRRAGTDKHLSIYDTDKVEFSSSETVHWEIVDPISTSTATVFSIRVKGSGRSGNAVQMLTKASNGQEIVSSSVSGTSGDLTVYAKYAPETNITFKIRGHESDPLITTTYTTTSTASISTAFTNAKMERLDCSGYRFYTTDAYTPAVEVNGTDMVGESDRTLYVDFTYNSASPIIRLNASINVNSVWYNIVDRSGNYRQYEDGPDGIYYNNTEANLRNAAHSFAFVGTDPYDVKVVSKVYPSSFFTLSYGDDQTPSDKGLYLKAVNITGTNKRNSWGIMAPGNSNAEFVSLVLNNGYTDNTRYYYHATTSNNRNKATTAYESLKPVEIPQMRTVRYVVVNEAGTDAIWYEVETTNSSALAVPAAIQSPLAENYRYYATRAHALTDDDANAVTYVSDINDDDEDGQVTAYVRYDKVADLSYFDGEFYLYVRSTSPQHQRQAVHNNNDIGSQQKDYNWQDKGWIWQFEGNDPYGFAIKNTGLNKYLTKGTTSSSNDGRTVYNATVGDAPTTLLLLYNNYSNQTGYQIMLMPSATDEPENYLLLFRPANQLFFGGTSNFTDRNNYDRHSVTLVKRNVVYHVVNNSGSVAIYSSRAQSAGDALAIPDDIKTPLAKNYRYYATLGDAVAGSNAITTVPAAQCHVYVRYDYNPDGDLDITGATKYNLRFVKPYTASQPGFIYSNGGGNAPRWENSSETKNTGDAYLWTFQGNDPYNMQVVNVLNNGYYMQAEWQNNVGIHTMFIRNAVNNSYMANGFFVAKNSDGTYALKYCGRTVTDYFYYLEWRNNNELMLTNPIDDNRATTSDNVRLYITDPFAVDVTYHVMKAANSEVVRKTVKQSFNHTPLLPAAIKSPWASGFTYFKDAACTNAYADGEQIASDASAGVHIYVRYENSATLNLNGEAGEFKYYLLFNDEYAYVSGSDLQTKPTRTEDNDHLWYIEAANDPYQVSLKNVGNSQYFHYGAATDGTTIGLSSTISFFYVREGAAEGLVELVALTGAPTDVSATSMALGRSGHDVKLYDAGTCEPGSSALQLRVQAPTQTVTLIIIDHGGGEVVRVENFDVEADQPISVPAQWRSPLATNWRFHVVKTNAQADKAIAAAGKPAAAFLQLTSAQLALGTIYARYSTITDEADADYVDLNPDVTDYKYRTSRSATDASQVRDAGQFGTLYMLKFHNGVPNYLENSRDEVETTLTQPVYPYANGDGQMYIYGSERWVSQSAGGASTRTRWPWYLLAVNNDPYHVMVTSWQNSHGRDNTNYYNFFRTYYNTAINQVVTTTVSDDPLVTTDATNGDASAVPTEYMLLGAKDAYKLVTSDIVSGDHQTVTCFEQYWKNSPTVENIAGANPAADNTTLAAKGWHRYGAWAYSAPWGGGSKTFHYDNHWYQTFSMGDGTFQLEPTEIDAVLVLTDLHGWEIMRHPIAKYRETDKYETVKQFLRRYDSPMVSQYRFYGYRSAPKVSGYHKYTLEAGDYLGAAPSLAGYPEKYSGGALYDLYVSYDVKPEYAEAYTGGATGGTANYPFLIRQGSHLAKTTDGSTITFEDATTTIDVNNVSALAEADHSELYWYLKPNFDIDTEMGYLYDVKDDGGNVISKAATNAAYHADGKSGFDPYNIQIYNKAYPTAYFNTNATAANTENHQYMVTTAPAGNGTLSLGNTSEKFTATIVDYDSKTLHITNATFMAVQDANGNMRLMPRFDHKHVVSDFGTLVEPAVAQPVDDKAHGQTTWLLRPEVYTYVIINNQGNEALRYQTVSTGAPTIPLTFRSPLATNFKFYKEATLTNEITESFATVKSQLTDNTVYVRYDYDPAADTDGLLKGTWYRAKLNGSDVKVGSSGVAQDTYSDDAAHRWRFMESAASEADPYDVTLWSGTPESYSGHPFIIMGHSSGTGYALMQAGNASTTQYYFLDGSSTPDITEQANYLATGTIATQKQLTLTPVVATSTVTYKIITHTGHVALTSSPVAVTASSVLATPEWMQSPLMKSDAYVFYPTATDNGDGTFTTQGHPTTTPATLDGQTVYVRYDYDKSKQAFTDFKRGQGDNADDDYTSYTTNATLDLSGKMAYVLNINNQQLWQSYNGSKVVLARNKDNLQTSGNRFYKSVSWLFKGNDPYEITLVNPAYSESMVLAVKEPTEAISNSDMTHRIVPQLRAPDDAEYTYNTFMLLKGAYKTRIGLKLYVTGHDDLFFAEANDVYVYKDKLGCEARIASGKEPADPGHYCNFIYRPNVVYHVITNEGKEAIWVNSARGRDYNSSKLVLPRMVQSPLLNESDYIYYKAATWDAVNSRYTLDEGDRISSMTDAQLAEQRISDVYVRYTYDRETSPLQFLDGFDKSTKHGLDLSGRTWYNMATARGNNSSDITACYTRVLRLADATDNNVYFGNYTYKTATGTFSFDKDNYNTTYGSLSNKMLLWRPEGNDPYAIKLRNASRGTDHYLSAINSGTGNLGFTFTSDSAPEADISTFMYLNIHSNNDGANYGATLIPTGRLSEKRSLNNISSELMILYTWDLLSYRLGTDGTVGSGSSHATWLYFYKAPVARKYHYHAYNTEKGQFTWDAILEHDFLTPVVLEDQIARLYAKYEANTVGTTLSVTGSNAFQTRAELEAADNAQFYSNEAMSQRVYDTTSNTYDIYPEITEEQVYDIYFKYQPDNEATVSGRKLGDITSTAAQIASDVAYRKDNGKLDQKHLTTDVHANWFYMVLDTDEGITATGTVGDGDREFTGGQYFLRREDTGKVSWMNNSYTLHHESADNYHQWSYNRLAENYRQGENDAFREGRWLWTFVGDDPYTLRLLNMESAVGVTPEGEGVYKLSPATGCWTVIGTETTTETTSGVTVTTTTHPLSIPASEPTQSHLWGITAGYGGEETFSLLSTAITEKLNGIDVNQALYWQMEKGVAAGTKRADDRTQSIQLLPYQPVKYEDVQIVIRRKDEVDDFRTWAAANPSAADTEVQEQLDAMQTGIAKLYFAAHERAFVAGDVIDLADHDNTLPFNVRRAFCNYTLYKSEEPFDEEGGVYTVQAGPYPDYTKPKYNSAHTDYLYDADGHIIYEYYDVDEDGNFTGPEIVRGAQSIYAHYVVTSDVFLSRAPTQSEVQTMAAENDHVFFMDFPDSSGPASYHYAYYDPASTFYDLTGDLKRKIDRISGTFKTEKKKYSGGSFVDDTEEVYNHYQYRTANNRMVSIPERLKWYFVGDPYKVQVYNVSGDWGSNHATSSWATANGKTEATVAANLARFHETETNFQFVVDCVHLRVPDYSNIDTRSEVTRTDASGKELETIHNRHAGEPYYNDFYWECVPAVSDDEGTFALRFKEDNDLLGYRNVYYYLAHDGLTKTYLAEGDNQSYRINLSYSADNQTHGSGSYADYHKANDQNTIIRLVQPAKVYVSAYKPADEDIADYSYPDGERQTQDELCEYFGVGETLNEVPRHLQRKFVSYGQLTNTASNISSASVTLADNTTESTAGRAYNMEVCHGTVPTVNDLMPSPVTKLKADAVYKFNVNYKMNDMTNDADGHIIHLFTADLASPQWVDMTVASTNWLYFDKSQVDATQLANYRTAVNDNTADGWNTGLKGLHWALVGDPYDFTILNRRRYEDGNNAGAQWMAIHKTTVNDYAGTPDSVVWTSSLVDGADLASYSAATSTAVAAADHAAHFSLQMWKLSPQNGNGTYQTGNADGQYFLRTASLKTGENDGIDGSATNQTSNYWRMVRSNYGSPTSSYFQMVPYSLAEKSAYTNTNYTENFSRTMNNLGVVQQRAELRTAVARDNDGADNNCFDADVEIRTTTGVLRLKQAGMELRHGDVQRALPVSLRRYGCTYKCYLNYDPATASGTEITHFGELSGETGYDELTAAIAAARAAHESDPSKSGNVTVTYVYEVTDDMAQFFTTEQDAKMDDYTWMNSYFYWEQVYSGTNVEVEKTRRKFDHYVYNSAGQIVDEVWIEESYIEIVPNPSGSYPTKGFLNTHTDQTPVYANETTQSENERQKWSLTGDPYSFTMKNYAQYLLNDDATTLLSGDKVATQESGQGQLFAIAVDKKGTPYLAVIDTDPSSPTYGTLKKLVDFEFSNTSDKSLETVGEGINPLDPTGNTIANIYQRNKQNVTVKPFYLASLIRYADVLVYHLVMAHQHSLDYEDTGLTSDQLNGYGENQSPTGVSARLKEFLQYWGKRNSTTYLKNDNVTPDELTTQIADSNPGAVLVDPSAVRTLLKQKGTLRNFLSYPVPDQEVARVGIGNRPKEPWYMQRQFCTYYKYQRDVQRSEPDPLNPLIVQKNGVDCYVWANDVDGLVDTVAVTAPGKPSPWYKACHVKWVSLFDPSYWNTPDSSTSSDSIYTVTADDVAKWKNGLVEGQQKKIPKYYREALGQQGKILEKLSDCHHNRKVIIDVVYEVNTDQFRFAERGRNTNSWYQMMTYNAADGLMNFTYLNGIGARLDRTHHYTNNYLWAPEGDPYGFVLRSRYATLNGTGWDDVAVTTKGLLPKGKEGDTEKYIDGSGTVSDFTEPSDDGKMATYTGRANSSGGLPFNNRRIIHLRSGQEGATTDGATNAVYEMFRGNFDNSFLMHPVAAWMDNTDADHESYYMRHNTADNTTLLTRATAKTLLADADANWRLQATSEQLIPYFQRSGYVGGLDPLKAQSFTNRNYYTQLQQSIAGGAELPFATVRKIQELVYSGTFYKSDGTTVVNPEDARPTGTDLPMKFEAENLVNMKPGYYRIRAFSEDALNTDGNDLSGTGLKGIVGPRYVSGYRFESEKDDPNDATNNADPNTNGRWLHFFETDMKTKSFRTFADLKARIAAVDEAVNAMTISDEEKAKLKDRDVFSHRAMEGNIEILSADFDPSSIFRFSEATSDTYKRYTISTQGLDLHARPGGTEGTAVPFGKTELNAAGAELATGFDNKFRLEDIGGAATTIRVRKYELGDYLLDGDGNATSTRLTGWDDIVAENLKTNYVCIDRNHRYRITCHKDNEMVEIGDHYTTDGLNGIQDTKWLLQPVGIREDWPYNQMPLRVEVQQGGVRDQTLEGVALTAAENRDGYYYGSLYVPFDTRMGNTTDAAFTLTADPTASQTTVTMKSVSQMNGMGNPQYVPAAWPVVLRTGKPGEAELKNLDGTSYATRRYVNLYLPYDEPQSVDKSDIKLEGQYLEQQLSTSRRVMVFGLPFDSHNETHDDADVDHHEYDQLKQVGWYTNDNWDRQSYPQYKAHAAAYSAANCSPGTVATDAQRDNLYVYHNRVYYLYEEPSPAKRHIVAIFDGDELLPEEPESPQRQSITDEDDTPWPCDVFDLQGRRVAEQETPATLRKNHPSLPKGVYIFGGRKVIVR